MGLHTFADRYAGGNLRLAAEKLALCGQATTDPLPGNAAFARAHETLAEIRGQQNSPEDDQRHLASNSSRKVEKA